MVIPGLVPLGVVIPGMAGRGGPGPRGGRRRGEVRVNVDNAGMLGYPLSVINLPSLGPGPGVEPPSSSPVSLLV